MTPRIDYLTKDFAGFRDQMLDALTARVPGWQERAPADLGISVVEVLAYAADYLSYHQDAVATEAYLETARRRVSLRRHALLLDYRISEGANARTWVAVEVSAAAVLPRRTRLLTRVGRLPAVLRPGSPALAQAVAGGAVSFETLIDTPLEPRHNLFRVDRDVPPALRGDAATSAYLCGHHRLRRGQVLIFTAASGPAHAVRLSQSSVTTAVLGRPVTEVRWFEEDTLPSHLLAARHLWVRGNIVLAGHGQTVEEHLPRVPARGSYRPRLGTGELTFEEPLEPDKLLALPAAAALHQDAHRTLPAIVLQEERPHSRRAGEGFPGALWRPRYDLLESHRLARDFVVEIENDGRGTLRFGADDFGRRPLPGSRFRASYRVGLGPRGNLGPGALFHVVTELKEVESVENPLDAVGGQAPEESEAIKRRAPFAFHRQLRCVADRDYVAVALRQRGVRGASAARQADPAGALATLRLQRPGGRPVDDPFKRRIESAFEPFLLLGTRLEVLGPLWTGLEIVLRVWPTKGVSDLALIRELEKAVHGFTRSDHFTFGEPVELEPILERTRRVPGVAAVLAVTFRRLRPPEIDGLTSGEIAIAPDEIAALRNEPRHPELGSIRFELETPRGR